MTDAKKSRVRELEYRIETSDKPGELLLTITKQSHRGEEFHGDGGHQFAFGGLTLDSDELPEWAPDFDAVFVRGFAKHLDNEPMTIPAADIGRVVAALEAYRWAFQPAFAD